MLLPSSDVGLMTSHLQSHDGLIKNLKMHLEKVENPALRSLMELKLKTMRAHVAVMMEMLDPAKNDFSEVPPLEDLQDSSSDENNDAQTDNSLEIHLALEAKTSTQSMAMDNFISSLKMKNPEVKHAHVEMALQQVQILKGLTEFLKKNNAEITPFSTEEEQRKVLDHFKHLANE